MGVAAGGNINPDPGGTSMFECMGGSAPKYTGQNVINPILQRSLRWECCLSRPDILNLADKVTKAIKVVTGTKMESMSADAWATPPRKWGTGLRESVMLMLSRQND